MRERRWVHASIVAGLAGMLGLGPVTGVSAAPAQDAGDRAEACAPATAVPEVGPRGCKSIEAGTWLLASGCRRVDPLEEPVCPSVDGRPVHPAAMAAFEASWLHRALELQRQLDLDVPLSQALLPHTHNSANSSAYAPSVSSLDANQVLSLTDQLRLGIRAIEIDIHWTPHPGGDPAQGGRAVVQCHGEPVATPAGVLHAGCSVDTPLTDLLREVRAWLDRPENAGDVLLLYLENALDDDPAAHTSAVAAIEGALGGLVARPEPGAGCQPLPVDRTKRELLDAGTRVLITGNCGPGGWTDWVHERGARWDESGGSSFDCAAERAAMDFERTFVRRYEDSTWLSAMAGAGSHRDAAQVAAMVRCGVDLVGFDQLHPGDDRLPGLVWSWRIDEPSAAPTARCAALGTDGRFFATGCAARHPVACRTPSGAWAIGPKAVAWSSGDDACRKAGHAGAGVPFNGWDSTRLRTAADDAGAGEVWVAYGRGANGSWATGIPSTKPGPGPRPHGGAPRLGWAPTAGVGAAAGSADLARSTAASTHRLPAATIPAFVALLVTLALLSARRSRPA